jgi:thermostable 8-oxoguanine DNA glycosylase
MTSKIPTPTLKKLQEMPPGIARDLFARINERQLARERRELDAAETARTARDSLARITHADALGLAEAAHYLRLVAREDGGLMADIYRQHHSRAIAEQLEQLDGSTDADIAAARLAIIETELEDLGALPDSDSDSDTDPDDDGPMAA